MSKTDDLIYAPVGNPSGDPDPLAKPATSPYSMTAQLPGRFQNVTQRIVSFMAQRWKITNIWGKVQKGNCTAKLLVNGVERASLSVATYPNSTTVDITVEIADSITLMITDTYTSPEDLELCLIGEKP